MTRRVPITRTVFLLIALTLGAAVMIAPFLYMLSTSLKGQIYVLDVPPQFIPKQPTLQNYIDAWQINNFALYFANSLIVAVATTIGTALISAMFAYALARFSFRGRSVAFYAVLIMLMVPGLMLIIPQFILATKLGLRNSLPGLVFVYIATSLPLNVFLLRGFFEQLPRELEDAVLIDGGNHFTVFFRVALPLSTPALATVAIFSFLFSWDEFTWALTAIDDMAKRTLPVAIATFQGQYVTQWGLVFAASLIAIIPVIIIFVALQRFFIKGLTAGAVRG
ncbi:MAG: carbohydrate ABC transporter permease [Anaerolineae bacterium]